MYYYLCAKFDDYTFSHFGFADRQTHRQTDIGVSTGWRKNGATISLQIF